MHGRGNADHNDESNPSGHVRDDDESSKSEAGAGNDMPGDGRTSDARPDTRLSNASLMTSLGHNAPTYVVIILVLASISLIFTPIACARGLRSFVRR